MSDTIVDERPAATTLPADFVAGFVPRHAVPASMLATALAAPTGFAAVDMGAPLPPPRHFSPADPAHNPTEGWDPHDPSGNADATPAPATLDLIAAAADAAHLAGFDEGLLAARAEAAMNAARDTALFDALAAALAPAVDHDALAQRLRQTVMLLVTKLVGECGVSADLLTARIAAATDLLAQPRGAATLRINPADAALLDGRLPAGVAALPDAAIERGAFVLESETTLVEDGPDLWLTQLAEAIERAPTPSC